jgi:hypothetical protein
MSASPDDRGFAPVKYAGRVVGDRGHLVMMLDAAGVLRVSAPGSLPFRNPQTLTTVTSLI